MMKIVLTISLLFLGLSSFANGIVTLKQIEEKEISPGEAISFEVTSNKGFVSMEASALTMQYILPYLFIDRIEKQNELIILKGFVTNSVEDFQPIKINDKNILFNISNESIKKDPIELQEGFFLFSETFIESMRKVYQILILLVLALCVFIVGKFILPKIKEKKKWKREQEIVALKIKNLKTIEDLENLYKEKKRVANFFNYDEKDFNKLLSLIEEEQYKKNWNSEKLDNVLKHARKLKFEKRKYGRA